MKKIALLAVTVLLCAAGYSQLIKMPSRSKHHTYSHRGLFVGKKHGARTTKLEDRQLIAKEHRPSKRKTV